MCTLQLMAKENMMSTFMILCSYDNYTTFVSFACIVWLKKQSRQIQILCNIREQKERVRDEIMKWIISIERCHDIIRIGPRTFVNLYALLRDRGSLQHIQRVKIEEQVAKFLWCKVLANKFLFPKI